MIVTLSGWKKLVLIICQKKEKKTINNIAVSKTTKELLLEWTNEKVFPITCMNH